MKLRIRGNSIRLRLTQTEVENFGNKGLVEETTDFGGGKKFVCALVSNGEAQKISADFADGKMQIFVPQKTAQNWANGEDVGIEGETETLKIIVEKDFTCLKPRENGDDTDTFPHPENNWEAEI